MLFRSTVKHAPQGAHCHATAPHTLTDLELTTNQASAVADAVDAAVVGAVGSLVELVGFAPNASVSLFTLCAA